MNSMSLIGAKGLNVLKWLKLFVPLSELRFYPPQFIIRNPMIGAVKSSFAKGHEVTVVVFNIADLLNLKENMQNKQYESYIKYIKRAFKEAIIELIPKNDIVMLHDYNSDGITLLMRMDCTEKKLQELDDTIYEILMCVKEKLNDAYPSIRSSFVTGYMFIAKKYYSLEDAVSKAHQQAVAIAERKMEYENHGLTETINQIISEQNIRLLAQPIFEVATNQIKAYEVLTRGPAGTDLESPLILFSVARQMGKLYELEKIVLEKTFEQISENESSQHVFINFTPVTLGNPLFIQEIQAMLKKYQGVSAKQVVLEVTEQDPIMQQTDFNKNIHLLRELGFRLAVDDTGIGYSTLSSIIEIMPEIIKIDRSVIQDIDSNTIKESMLKGLLLIAKESGSVVVAEGIESKGEAMVLSRHNVDLAQGYFYGRPASVDRMSMSTER
jgi:EAL domain-containing protein (putative c-di-GMP-specific phosphodiesterase class I)